MNDNAYKGFLLSLALRFRVHLIYSTGEKDTAKYISLLANKKESKEISLRPNKKLMSKDEQIQFILEGLPCVGPSKAKKLIMEFGSLKNIVNASIADLEKVIGKSAKDIYEIFNQEFES